MPVNERSEYIGALVEFGFKDAKLGTYKIWEKVSILVLVEFSFKAVYNAEKTIADTSFNPCFSGIGSSIIPKKIVSTYPPMS